MNTQIRTRRQADQAIRRAKAKHSQYISAGMHLMRQMENVSHYAQRAQEAAQRLEARANEEGNQLAAMHAELANNAWDCAYTNQELAFRLRDRAQGMIAASEDRMNEAIAEIEAEYKALDEADRVNETWF